MELATIRKLIDQGKEIKFYQSRPWRKVRARVLRRDNNECQPCKRRGKVTTPIPHDPSTLSATASDKEKNEEVKPIVLHVHHKKELKDYPELALVESNLETVCIPCHNEIHDRLVGYQTKKENKWNDERW